MKRKTLVTALLASIAGCDIGSVTLDLSSFETFEYRVRPAWVLPKIESAVVRRTSEGAYTATLVAYADCVNGETQHSFGYEPATVTHLLSAEEAAALTAGFASVPVQLYFVPWAYLDVSVGTFCWDSLCGSALKQFPGGVSVSETKALEIEALLGAMLTAELCAEHAEPSADAMATASQLRSDP